MNKSIKYILEQLTNDEESRERFNQLTELKACLRSGQNNFIEFCGGLELRHLSKMGIKELIRTALSRTQDGAVLSALEGTWSEAMGKIPKHKTEVLYHAFDKRLYFGDSLDSALAALDKKMEELKLI